MTTRRDLIKGAIAGSIVGSAALGSTATSTPASAAPPDGPGARGGNARPNIVLFVSDEFRADFVGASGRNPTTRTPNLDRIAQRGTIFTHAVTNQPLCSPSRACLLTGRYATETGMWKLNVNMRQDLPTLASILRSNGYTANFIGKWHLAPVDLHNPKTFGYVAPEYRQGFLDFWEGANVLELTSHPYAGAIWDSQGKPIRFQGEYRSEFITDRAVRFLKQPQEKPFLLYISQLEPHFQNDLRAVVAPKGYAARYQNPFVPPDLLHLPGVWQEQLPDYYGCVEKIDESVGRILETLEEQKLLDNTIFLFTSDHGCHFQTRENNYKRTPHDSSIRIPLLLQGPGVAPDLRLDQITGNINVTPTLLELAGVEAPSSMKGRNMVPLMRDAQARQDWKDRELIQISDMNDRGIGRAVRSTQWTYSIADTTSRSKVPSVSSYDEYVMFNNFADPAQLVNLLARVPYKEETARLQDQLLDLIAFSGESKPAIVPAELYQP